MQKQNRATMKRKRALLLFAVSAAGALHPSFFAGTSVTAEPVHVSYHHSASSWKDVMLPIAFMGGFIATPFVIHYLYTQWCKSRENKKGFDELFAPLFKRYEQVFQAFDALTVAPNDIKLSKHLEKKLKAIIRASQASTMYPFINFRDQLRKDLRSIEWRRQLIHRTCNATATPKEQTQLAQLDELENRLKEICQKLPEYSEMALEMRHALTSKMQRNSHSNAAFLQ